MRRIKQLLKSVPLLHAAVRITKQRYQTWKNNPVRHISKVLDGKSNAFVVQIGSNDGSTGDPIHALLMSNLTWRALLIEPVPFLFERLKKNYPNDGRFCFENVAIAEATGVSLFYYIDASAKKCLPDLPNWYDQLGSFDRNHIAKHFGNKLDEFIVQTEIPTIHLSSLFERNKIKAIDLLHIDTEGYDWIVLRQLDLKCFAPKVILFEHKHLTPEAKSEACAFLLHDYKLIDLGADFFCQRIRSDPSNGDG